MSLRRPLRMSFVALVVAVLLVVPVLAADVVTGPSVRSDLGMVAAGHPLAAQAGAEILAKGGNAVDAAVAVAYALAVVEPYASNVGGEGYMVISMADGTDISIDFRSRAPLHVNVHTPGEIGIHPHGIYTTMVPGLVKGTALALQKYGTMSFAEVLEPAIRLAEEGIVVDGVLATSIADGYDTLLQYEAAAAIWLDNGLIPETGTFIRNPDLAHTMRLIAEHGADVFYYGEIAEAIEAATDGWIDRASLAAYEAYERPVVRGTYRGYEVIGAAPIVSGVRVQQTLNILENFDVASFGSVTDPRAIHLISEALKLTLADFEEYMWDPNFYRIPVEGLLSKEYAAERARLIDMNRAQSFGPGNPYTYSPEVTVDNVYRTDESPSTTHFGVLDKDGNAVAVTQTISSIWGSRVVVPGYGFLLSNHFRQFPVFDANDPFRPDYAAPLKTTKTNLSPTIIKQDGEVKFVVGSPGGVRIPTTTVQMIVSMLDFGMDLEEAILTPKTYADNNVNLDLEGGYPEEVIEALRALGHNVTTRPPLQRVFGSMNVIWVEDDGTMWGRGSYRRDGGASAPLSIERGISQ